MKFSRKRKPDKDISDLGFDAALARFIQTVPADLANVHERVAKSAEDIERDAEEHFKDIKSGGRHFTRPFRP